MTTQKQIKSVLRSVLATEKDIALIGRDVYVTPIKKIARCISFEKLSNPDSFRLRWHVNHLFGKLHAADTIWGKWLQDSEKRYSWTWTSRSLEEDIFNVTTKVALPKLRRINTIEDYIGMVNFIDAGQPHRDVDFDASPSETEIREFSQKDYPTRFPSDRALILMALGRTEDAAAMCEEIPYFDVKNPGKNRFPLPHMNFFFDVLCPMLRENDRKKIILLLHSLEEEKIRFHKLEKFWSRIPFPLELMQENSGRSLPGQFSGKAVQ